MGTKICIYGAGAVGGYMGARLARANAQISLVARGPHLEAIQQNGLALDENGAREIHTLTATSDPLELGPQDFVVVSLKAHSITAVVDAMRPLLGPETAVLFAVNGVPWWYFHKLDGPHEGKRLESVDPGDRIWNGVGPDRAIGCVVYPAAQVPEFGVIQHISGDRFSLGEPSGEKTERVEHFSALMQEAGFRAPIRPRIRDEIWIKLWGNCSLNPVSALTHATIEQMCQDPPTRALLRQIMVEAQTVGEALGVKFSIDVDKRLAGAEAVGAHKTSMLQDLERGRPMELDALVGAVSELGRMAHVATPTLDMIQGLLALRARLAGQETG